MLKEFRQSKEFDKIRVFEEKFNIIEKERSWIESDDSLNFSVNQSVVEEPKKPQIRCSNAFSQTEVDGFFDLATETKLEELKIQYAES